MSITDPKAHVIWQKLFERQFKSLKGKVHPWFWEGLKLLNINPNKLPNLEELDERLFTVAKWKTEVTNIQYAEDALWFHFCRKDGLCEPIISEL